MSLESIDLAPPGPRNDGTAQSALLRRIDLTTLRLFIAVCEEKNLTRAASREGIAASAVSKRMADFELAFASGMPAGSAPKSLTPAASFRAMPQATGNNILHCNKSAKQPLLKGQWHFGRLLCIGAANIQGRRAARARFEKFRREETCIN